MAYPLRLSSHGIPAAGPRASTAHDSDERAHTDLSLARMTRTNVLLVGSEGRLEHLVNVHAAEIDAELVIRCQDAPPGLPPASSQSGPVILRDVDFLTPSDQRRLLEWLDSTNGMQVVSTASASLLPLVEAGAFSAALYYRLNTVYIDLSQ